MISCSGIGINDFIAIGQAKVIVTRTDDDYPKTASDSKAELERLSKAMELAKLQLQELHDKTEETAGANEALIFEMNQMMLEDGLVSPGSV